jgi:hypothetical protein
VVAAASGGHVGFDTTTAYHDAVLADHPVSYWPLDDTDAIT